MKPICIDNDEKSPENSKREKRLKMYNQMLINYAGPPGPANRGIKSEVSQDRRPMHEQAADIKDKKRI